MMWWLFSPASRRMWTVMSDRRAKAMKNSWTSWVSKLPTFSVGISSAQHSIPRPLMSTAVRISASSMGRVQEP